MAIVGGPGSGKTTALRHLETVLPPWANVKLLDEPEPLDELVTAAANRRVVYTTREPFQRIAGPSIALLPGRAMIGSSTCSRPTGRAALR